MSPAGKLSRLLPVVALLLGAAVLVAPWRGHAGKTEDDALPGRLASWEVPEMIEHLRAAGLDLRVRATARDGEVNRSAFLCETERDWMELNLLRKAPEQVGKWQGVLSVERGRNDETWEVQARQWGDACLVAGPFIFFGDPGLLARARAALRVDAP
jgi:hypothetical protein